jgi:protein-tyrosine-phosphatase
MQKNQFNKSKKLYQIILATVMFGCASAYAAGSPDENGVNAEQPTMTTFAGTPAANSTDEEKVTAFHGGSNPVEHGTCYNDDKNGTTMFKWVLSKKNGPDSAGDSYSIITKSNYTTWKDTTKTMARHSNEPYSKFSVNGEKHIYEIERNGTSSSQDHPFIVKIFDNSTIPPHLLHTLTPRCEINKKPTVLFVCGGNTGRSFAGANRTQFNGIYGNYVSTFSRGSGITSTDSLTPEKPMVSELLKDEAIPEENKQHLQNAIAKHIATPASTIDIDRADIVLAMTASHKQRLLNLIDKECTPASLNASNMLDSEKNKLKLACANTSQLKSKIHTLIGCATGTDGDIADAYGTPPEKETEVYQDVYKAIAENIDLVMKNTADHATTRQTHAPGKLGLSYDPNFNPYANIYCKK